MIKPTRKRKKTPFIVILKFTGDVKSPVVYLKISGDAKIPIVPSLELEEMPKLPLLIL